MENWCIYVGLMGLSFFLGYCVAALKARSLAVQLELQKHLSDSVTEQNKNLALKGEEAVAATHEAHLKARELEVQVKTLREQNEQVVLQQEQMREQFKGIALAELREKSKELQGDNKEQINHLLTPLKEQLALLNKSVVDNQVAGAKNQTFIEKALYDISAQADRMGSDAIALARALKGNSKVQGDWGEMVLENLLTHSGLSKGVEYEMQPSYATSQGAQLRPDVVVSFPQGQHLVIDSKVSLTAYSNWAEAEDKESQSMHLRQHLASIRSHIKELFEKNYPQVVPNSFQYVLMFIPNEGSYIEAIKAEPNLLQEAQVKNILLISPANLIMAIKLCYFLWQRDKQERNLENIVKEGGELYNKFVTFLDAFTQIDKSLDKAKERYHESYKLLVSGRGNITRRLDNLRQMGVSPKKLLPEQVLADAESEVS